MKTVPLLTIEFIGQGSDMSAQASVATLHAEDVASFLIDTFRSYNDQGTETWSASTPIDAIGIDSFDFVEILFKIEDHYGVDLGYNANIKFSALTTIQDLADHIVKITSGKLAA